MKSCDDEIGRPGELKPLAFFLYCLATAPMDMSALAKLSPSWTKHDSKMNEQELRWLQMDSYKV